MIDITLLLFQFMLILLAADMVTGLAHWAQDRFGTANGSIFDSLFIYRAAEHHNLPFKVTQYPWYQRALLPISIVALLIFPLFAAGFLGWKFSLFAFLLAVSGEVHVLAHRNGEDVPRLLRKLQEVGLIQSPEHHRDHHRNHDSRYCILTNYVNPVLDKVNFFFILDRLIVTPKGRKIVDC